MKLLMMVVIALGAMATDAKTKKTEAGAKKREPAQVAPKGPVTTAEKAAVCRGIEARYRSTRWDKCRKGKFTRDKEQVRVTLKQGKSSQKCRAQLKARARSFDLKSLKCE